jgi:hypothetical protein
MTKKTSSGIEWLDKIIQGVYIEGDPILIEGGTGSDKKIFTIFFAHRNYSIGNSQKIIATPVLIKELPLPIRRIIGDLNDHENVLVGLDLYAT